MKRELLWYLALGLSLFGMVWWLVGCHGTELRVGTGRTFNDFAGGGQTELALGDEWGGGTGVTSYDFEQEDSWNLYAELAFQLTPKSVVLQEPRASTSWEPGWVPVDLPTYEDKEEDYISWGDIGLGGAGTTGTAALVWGAYAVNQRRKKLKPQPSSE